MFFDVRHTTQYDYSTPVQLADHVLRLSPRPDRVRALTHQLEIFPPPLRQDAGTDSHGNHLTHLSFSGETRAFSVVSHLSCEVTGPAPLDHRAAWADMSPYLAQTPIDPDVVGFATDLMSGRTVTGFLDALTQSLYRRTDRLIRHEGNAQTAGETLRTARGACRDLTVLFIDACRSQGLPARFVSGYQARAESVDGNRHLHAWPEVWLPDTGWVGYDPTHGVATGDTHLPLAAAPFQADTMPVQGGFYANGVTSTLTFTLEIVTR